MDIRKKLTPVNFARGINKQVRAIVWHSAAGFYEGSISWAHNPKSKASFHYIISAKGEITQVVEDEDIAWHAGFFDEPLPEFLRPNPNLFTIGVEFEDKRDPNWAYPEAQRKAGIWLAKHLSSKWKLPLDSKHHLLHKNLNPSRRSDPQGQFSLKWLLEDQMADETMVIEKSLFERIRDASEKFDQTVNYLEIGKGRDNFDPTLTPFEEVRSVIAGLKSRATSLSNDLATANGELSNKTEQVSRLKQQLLDEGSVHKALVISLNKQLKEANVLAGVHEADAKAKQEKIETLSKEKGALNTELHKCQANQHKPTTFWDILLKIIKRG